MKESKMNWYEIKAKGEDKAEVWIYDEIGEGFFGEGVSAKQFISELNDITAKNIDLHVNSPGGLVRDGLAIHNAIARHPANITGYVDGGAWSIASTAVLAANTVVMAENSTMMIHSAWARVMGNAVELRHRADVLEKHDQAIAGIYQRKSGQDTEVIQDAMAAETWYTAEEAVEFGLADRVEEGLKAVALSLSDEVMARFKNAPDLSQLKATIEPTPTPDNMNITIVNNLPSTGAVVDDSDGASQTEPIDLQYELIEHRRNK